MQSFIFSLYCFVIVCLGIYRRWDLPVQFIYLITFIVVMGKYQIEKAIKPPKRKVIFLSSLGLGGIDILRCFGQIPGSQIYNEYSTYCERPKMTKFRAYHQEADEKHERQITRIIELADKHDGCVFFHEMAGELNDRELHRLKENNFIIVAILRHPGKQITFLHSLNFELESRINIMKHGWLNLLHFWKREMLDHIIDYNEFLKDEKYRELKFQKMGLVYCNKYATEMSRFRNYEFFDICAICNDRRDPTSNDYGPYSGREGVNWRLRDRDDTGEMSDKDVDDVSEKALLCNAVGIYKKMLGWA